MLGEHLGETFEAWDNLLLIFLHLPITLSWKNTTQTGMSEDGSTLTSWALHILLTCHHCQFIGFWVVVFCFIDFIILLFYWLHASIAYLGMWAKQLSLGFIRALTAGTMGFCLLSASLYPEKDILNFKSHHVSTLSLTSRGGKKHI